MPKSPAKTAPRAMTPLVDQLYLIETQMQALRQERADVIRQLDAEYWPELRDRLRKRDADYLHAKHKSARKRG